MSYWDGTHWVADTTAPAPSTTSRRASWAATAVMILGLAALVVPFAATSAAARGTSWIVLKQPAGAVAIQPTLGGTVAFDTGYPNNVKNPRIEILCYQGGSLVYGAAGGVTDSFLLGGAGSIWLTFGGSANCTANLFYFGFHAGRQTYNPLATTSFAAGG
jgi:hypothetical protein